MRAEQGTYAEIRKWVKQQFGFAPKDCWIAHCKELKGLPLKRAWNRRGALRIVPCPPEKQAAIERAFRHFGMLS